MDVVEAALGLPFWASSYASKDVQRLVWGDINHRLAFLEFLDLEAE